MVHDNDPKLTFLATREAAEFLGMRPGTLAIWRCKGRYGLPYVRIGYSIRYRLSDLITFTERQTISGVEPRSKRAKA